MNCREVSTTVAGGPLAERSIRVRVQVWLHLMMCRHCRRFARQIRALDNGVRAALRGLQEEMPPDLARRIADRLARRSEDGR